MGSNQTCVGSDRDNLRRVYSTIHVYSSDQSLNVYMYFRREFLFMGLYRIFHRD
jgi:hypothetical protein